GAMLADIKISNWHRQLFDEEIRKLPVVPFILKRAAQLFDSYWIPHVEKLVEWGRATWCGVDWLVMVSFYGDLRDKLTKSIDHAKALACRFKSPELDEMIIFMKRLRECIEKELDKASEAKEKTEEDTVLSALTMGLFVETADSLLWTIKGGCESTVVKPRVQELLEGVLLGPVPAREEVPRLWEAAELYAQHEVSVWELFGEHMASIKGNREAMLNLAVTCGKRSASAAVLGAYIAQSKQMIAAHLEMLGYFESKFRTKVFKIVTETGVSEKKELTADSAMLTVVSKVSVRWSIRTVFDLFRRQHTSFEDEMLSLYAGMLQSIPSSVSIAKMQPGQFIELLCRRFPLDLVWDLWLLVTSSQGSRIDKKKYRDILNAQKSALAPSLIRQQLRSEHGVHMKFLEQFKPFLPRLRSARIVPTPAFQANCFGFALMLREYVGAPSRCSRWWGGFGRIDQFFRMRCYYPCPESEAEIALFAKWNEPKHAARKIGGNLWMSKLGQSQLVVHALRDLEGPRYGRVVRYYGKGKGAGSQNAVRRGRDSAMLAASPVSSILHLASSHRQLMRRFLPDTRHQIPDTILDFSKLILLDWVWALRARVEFIEWLKLCVKATGLMDSFVHSAEKIFSRSPFFVVRSPARYGSVVRMRTTTAQDPTQIVWRRYLTDKAMLADGVVDAAGKTATIYKEEFIAKFMEPDNEPWQQFRAMIEADPDQKQFESIWYELVERVHEIELALAAQAQT
ncbi:MAG TPA: hypothetical protein VLJ10_01875, partial [Candidatus Bathyarchaeia archaeon]|nr:hypothetical protein [Candidatus Bathyarchaeia archaeon]